MKKNFVNDIGNQAQNINDFLTDLCQKIVESGLTDEQKQIIAYGIHEELLKELLSTEDTLGVMTNKYGDEKTNSMSVSMKARYMQMFGYKKELEKLIAPVAEYLFRSFKALGLSENYELELESHYKMRKGWSPDIRSNVTRRLKKACRGFGFKKDGDDK